MAIFVVTQGFLSRFDITQGYQAGTVVAPVADFSGSPLSGAVPLSVAFTDLSTNGPTSWLWNFSDGSTSTVQNPVHNYTVAGTYTIVLTATNAAGSNTKTKVAYVIVSIVPVPVVSSPVKPLAESSGASGGYTIPTQFGFNGTPTEASVIESLYPKGTGNFGPLDFTGQNRLQSKKRRRRRLLLLAAVLGAESWEELL